MKLIRNVKIVLKDRIEDGSILFSDKIEKIILKGSNNNFDKYLKYKEEIEIINGEGYYLAPGFIDIHFHGAAGFDTMDGSQDSLNKIKETVVRSGVTSFLATTMTMPLNKIRNVLMQLKK